jgi:quercetin dioxygenase-like cupin family protein
VIDGGTVSIRDVHVVVPTGAFDADLRELTDVHGFRLDAIFPADSPATAIVSGHGVRLRLDGRSAGGPVTLHMLTDDRTGEVDLPGGSRLEFRPFTRSYALPDNRPSLVVSHDTGDSGVGRAGMRYRDLIPDRWGGRFIASHITIPDGGPVPDYVHFHNIRFQLIFVKAGWVRVVYEDQGEPFVLEAGDGVLQPPEIRHRVLESSPGLEVIEVGCPAEHETIADHALALPTPVVDPERSFRGQRFVRHVAAEATYRPWRIGGWEHRDTGIGAATNGLAGVRVARPATADPTPDLPAISHDTEFALLVVLGGEVTFATEGCEAVRLAHGDSVAIPSGVRYRLDRATTDCELLDVTLPASFDTDR